MNRPRQARAAVGWRRVSVLLMAVSLGFPGMAPAEPPPGEMKLFLSPGSGNKEVIVFSSDAGGTIRRESSDGQEKNQGTETAAAGVSPLVPEVLPSEQEQGKQPRAQSGVVGQADDITPAISAIASDGESESVATTLEPFPAAPKETAPPPVDPYLYRSSISWGPGYRVDNLNWTISDTDGSPNSLSELDWRDVTSSVFATELRYSDSTHFYFRGNFEIGWIFDGSVRDSDYYGDDRTEEFSRSKSDTEDGSLYDFSAAAGYRFDIPAGRSPVRLHLIPLLGYTYNSQEFDITHGRQVLSDYGFAMEEGEFAGLHSSYDTLWKGPWLGIDLELRLGERHKVTGSYGYYWFDYEGQADWNLRDDFAHPVSFRHDADGEGTQVALGYRFSFNKQWHLSVFYSHVDISTDSGHDTTYFADGTEVDVPFNGASWDSSVWILGVGYNF